MAKRILPNRMRYDVAGKPGQDFSSKIDYSDDCKMSIHSCNTFLGLSSSCSQLERVKHIKFKHVLDTIFRWFWAESVQCAIVAIIANIQ